MLSKTLLPGASFEDSCRYLCEDLERAQVLAVEGVRARDYRQMAQDFDMQARLKPERERPVFHEILSFPSGEDPPDEKLVELARRQLEKTGITDTQYAIVKHIDTDHLHLHILANRVSNTGKIVGKGLIIVRGIKAAQELTREYNLRPVEGKNLELTNREALNGVDAKRYRLLEAIREELPLCRQLEDLENRLLARGITTRYKLDSSTGARVGISFRSEGYAFKGSSVDKEYSFRGLEERLALQRVQAQEQKEKMEVQQEIRQKVKEELRQDRVEELRQRRGPRLRM